MTVIGTPTKRIEGLEKITGAVRYTEDLQLPGTLHARLVLSPHPHARVTRLPRDVALAVAGVTAVVTEEDLPDPVESRLLAADGEAVYTGQPIAVVLAETESAAADAAEYLAAEMAYEILPAVLDPHQAMRPGAPLVSRDMKEDEEGAAHASVDVKGTAEAKPRNVATQLKFTRGDIEAGFRAADVIVEHTYRTSRLQQAYMEPHSTVAALDPVTGGVTVYTSTQALFYVRGQVARALGLPEQQVKVVAMTVGGAFGGKFSLLEPLTAALTLVAKRPVRLVLTRRDDFLMSTPGPEAEIWLRTGASSDGILTALAARIIYDSGAEPGAPASITATLLGGYYKTPNLQIESLEVLTHKPPNGAYRAPGAPQASFAIESQMSILAERLGLDPVEFRLRNCSQPGDPQPSGRPWAKMGLRQVLEALRDHPKYRGRERAEGVGYGVAVGGWPGGVESASACVRANTDGTFQVVLGMVDITGTATTMALIAAEVIGVPADRMRVVMTDTDQAPYAGATGGSKITYTVGLAVKAAAEDARRQILAIAAAELEARADDLEIAEGSVRVKGTPQKSIGLAEVARKSMSFGAKYPPINGNGSIASPKASPGFAAHLTKVRVDRETGVIEPLDMVVIQDVGFAINPATVEGQMRGGAVQGIGWGLLEAMAYDEHGTLLTWGFSEYALPKADGIPPIEVVMVEVPSEFGPFGAKGVGEPPVIPGGAAIANAVADATGVRLTSLPITPAKLLEALRGDGG